MASAANEIGARVRAWRIHQGFSQSQIEGRAGLAHNALSRIETGEVAPRLGTLERIADALGISIEQLQFRLPPRPQTLGPPQPDAGGSVELMEMIDSLPRERREEVVELLIQVVRQVRS